jgi:hypothetical protein
MATRHAWRYLVSAGLIVTSLLAISTRAAALGLVEVAPSEGTPTTTFSFTASGFKGDPEGDDNDAERADYWVTSPDGRVISQDPDDGDDGDEVPYSVRVGRDGVARWAWRAPADAAYGTYTMTARGRASTHEVTITFIVTRTPTSAQAGRVTITPSVSTPGTTFTISASGFKADDDGNDDGNDAEEVAYWINTPDGRVIDRDGNANDDDDDDDRPLRRRANRDGSLTVEWTAPAEAQAGRYTLVLYGRASGLELVVAFEIQAP